MFPVSDLVLLKVRPSNGGSCPSGDEERFYHDANIKENSMFNFMSEQRV